MTLRPSPSRSLQLAALALCLTGGLLGQTARAQQNSHIWEAGASPAASPLPPREPMRSWGPIATEESRATESRAPLRKETIRAQSPDFGSANPNPGPAPIPGPGAFSQPTPGIITGPPAVSPYGPPPLPPPGPAQQLPFGSGANIGGGVVNQPGPDGGQLAPPGSLMQPFAEDEGLVDIIGQVQETQTGRFSVGLGVNSDAGVLGNIVLEEQNFSATNWPSRPGDIIYGNAFRGDGQHFRVEAVPGNQLQRYTVAFNEPYLFDTPFSFGLNGFYYTRGFEDWRERRVGGNWTTGYQLRPDLSLGFTGRFEGVNVSNPRIPTPPDVQDVLGQNNLFSGKLTLLQDTRDNAFLPTEGYMVQMDYEQAFGQFTYPRGTIDARTYYLLYQRPDRSGRHVVSLRARAGVSGSDTPVFERFFVGGTTTIRGFDFRNASPVEMGTTVGGDFMLLGSVEYLLPVTADDSFRMVFFVDTGTAEKNVELHADSYRVAPGFGLRISVPGMGPAPIALDFAWPVVKADTDQTRVFSFYVGFLR